MTDVIFRNVSDSMLEKIIAIMQPLQPEPLNPEWDVDNAELLLRNLGPAARNLIISTAQAGGRLSASVLRGPENRTLKGLTGPIGKAIRRLVTAEKLPDHLPAPVEAEYDPANQAWQRTGAFVMPRPLVPVFKAAADRLADQP
jgi:hypothetical protein